MLGTDQLGLLTGRTPPRGLTKGGNGGWDNWSGGDGGEQGLEHWEPSREGLTQLCCARPMKITLGPARAQEKATSCFPGPGTFALLAVRCFDLLARELLPRQMSCFHDKVETKRGSREVSLSIVVPGQ